MEQSLPLLNPLPLKRRRLSPLQAARLQVVQAQTLEREIVFLVKILTCIDVRHSFFRVSAKKKTSH
ncbi:hypothetical protein HH214_06485 [Mucilaginibacter robiniae]|uniref:Uncharacterized protein n=1 Tax=Mucilaginibacter robiniae TaxID=2728022 RepID=A0A7L5E3Z9_9SPHI|nr:hypothetical protein [Mucilaginibacter robiniae]QJD95543.1 hypothetical protein HH214_06485 [Mucilaginibacter robiniae]